MLAPYYIPRLGTDPRKGDGVPSRGSLSREHRVLVCLFFSRKPNPELPITYLFVVSCSDCDDCGRLPAVSLVAITHDTKSYT